MIGQMTGQAVVRTEHLTGIRKVFFGIGGMPGGKLLQQQYKDNISDYHNWDQKDHAAEWLLFADNISGHLSIDGTCLSNGDGIPS